MRHPAPLRTIPIDTVVLHVWTLVSVAKGVTLWCSYSCSRHRYLVMLLTIDDESHRPPSHLSSPAHPATKIRSGLLIRPLSETSFPAAASPSTPTHRELSFPIPDDGIA